MLIYVVGSADPFQRTATGDRNPLPLTVSVNAPPPAVTEIGERLFTTIGGAVIVKVTALDAAPLESTTMIWAVPTDVRRLAGTCAVSYVALPTCVTRLLV